MNAQETINTWKDNCTEAQITADLSDDVMAQIYNYRQKKAAPLPKLTDFAIDIFHRPLARAAVAAAAVLGGFLRLGLTYYIILS